MALDKDIVGSIEFLFDQLKHIQNDIHQTEQAHTTISQKMNITEKDMRDVEDRLSEAKRIEATYEDKLYQAYRYTDKMRVRMESLETQAEDYSYFFNGVKHILKAKENTLSGIHGAVAEVIKVPSKLTAGFFKSICLR